MDEKFIKVSADSDAKKLSDDVSGRLRNEDCVAVQAIDEKDIAKALKVIALASSQLMDEGFEVWCKPIFVEAKHIGFHMESSTYGEEFHTAIRFEVEKRPFKYKP